jgi:hypothetical protein
VLLFLPRSKEFQLSFKLSRTPEQHLMLLSMMDLSSQKESSAEKQNSQMLKTAMKKLSRRFQRRMQVEVPRKMEEMHAAALLSD